MIDLRQILYITKEPIDFLLPGPQKSDLNLEGYSRRIGAWQMPKTRRRRRTGGHRGWPFCKKRRARGTRSPGKIQRTIQSIKVFITNTFVLR